MFRYKKTMNLDEALGHCTTTANMYKRTGGVFMIINSVPVGMQFLFGVISKQKRFP